MGEFTIANTLWARDFVETLVRSHFNIWFFIQIAVWLSVSAVVVMFADRFLHRSKGGITYRIEMNKRVLWKNFNVFLARKEQARKRGCKCMGFPVAGGFNSEHREANLNNHLVRRSWTEINTKSWGGCAPTITVWYDEDTIANIKDSEGMTQETIYLLKVEIQYNRHQASKKLQFNAKELHQRFVSVLKDNDIWMSDDMEDYRKLINDEPHAFYNNGGTITRAKVLTAIKGTMQSKKKQTFEVDNEETAATGINDKKKEM